MKNAPLDINGDTYNVEIAKPKRDSMGGGRGGFRGGRGGGGMCIFSFVMLFTGILSHDISMCELRPAHWESLV